MFDQSATTILIQAFGGGPFTDVCATYIRTHVRGAYIRTRSTCAFNSLHVYYAHTHTCILCTHVVHIRMLYII